ncbi:MAG: hypothetical protein ACP5RP_01025 [Candidatus Micrarchaeia archaeon]
MDIDKEAEKLWKDSSMENWEEFKKLLKKSKAAYYKVVYTTKNLKKVEDLTKSFAEIYDSNEKLMTKVPIIIKNGKNVEGALIYLKGLKSLNRY